MSKITDSNPDAKAVALLARAYSELEECKRKLKMRPLPKPIDVSLPAKQVRLLPREVSGSET